MLDEKGNFFIIEAILAISLLLFVFVIFNHVIFTENSDYSTVIKDSNNAQDIMEILSGKINFTDGTFVEDITLIMKNGKNSKESIEEVSQMCKNKFSSLNIKNYQFSETNVLNNKVLSSSGDYSNVNNVSVAIRTCYEYSYTLSVW
ncbi:MAG: hypothetical protein UHW99_07230 [Methanobrevibacter sp.]|nr:hypothetical protein [Methanobrevibacter sp.]